MAIGSPLREAAKALAKKSANSVVKSGFVTNVLAGPAARTAATSSLNTLTVGGKGAVGAAAKGFWNNWMGEATRNSALTVSQKWGYTLARGTATAGATMLGARFVGNNVRRAGRITGLWR